MVMGVAPMLVVFGAIYHWFPLISGKMLDERLGKFHFWVTFIGAYSIFLPLHYLGFLGVPRRYFELSGLEFIPDSVQSLNAFVTVVTLTVGFAQIVFFYNVAKTLISGKKAERNPWRAASLEWQTASYPPGHGNFDDLPLVYRWAYDYSVPGAKEDFLPQNMSPEEAGDARAEAT
jgi:cytochrome c oxidase subunit 1